MKKVIVLAVWLSCLNLFAAKINLITPNGGELLKTGQSLLIQWFPDSTYNSNAMITVYNDVSVVYQDTSNTGMKIWQIPADCPVSSKYMVRISDIYDPNNFDQSDSCFSIEQSGNTNTTDSVMTDVTENTIWTSDTVFVMNDIRVAAGKKLLIRSGCKVFFTGNYLLTVEGTVSAVGSASDKIVFDAANYENCWRGIYFPERLVTDSSIFTNCLFQHGKATDNDPNVSIHDHGGIIRAAKGNSIVVSDCEFEEDEALQNGGSIYVINAGLRVTNSIFHHNRAGNLGGAVYMENCYPFLNNNTIIYNHAGLGGGALALKNSDGFQNNNIYWFNSSVDGSQIYLCDDNSDPDFYNCNIEGGITGFGGSGSGSFYNGVSEEMLDANPQIIGDGAKSSYHLLANSPCIDRGINNYDNFPQYDIYGNPRICGGRADIGAYEYRSTGVSGALEVRKCDLKLRNYPNPFNNTTQIRFDLPVRSQVKLDVFNIQGQLVYSITQGLMPAGQHLLDFDAAFLHSGVYFCRMSTPYLSSTIKIMLCK